MRERPEDLKTAINVQKFKGKHEHNKYGNNNQEANNF